MSIICGLVQSREHKSSFVYRDANRNYFIHCVISEVPVNTTNIEYDESFTYLIGITLFLGPCIFSNEEK
jgi:hypothetical protein